MSPIPRETTCREVRVPHRMHSPSNAFINLNASYFVRVLLVTCIPPALALSSKDTESPRTPALL